MADTPSAILLLRLQGTGGNINTWGGYLNIALETLEQAAKGYQALTVASSATVSWTQYAIGNTGQCAVLRLTGPSGDGTLTSAATLTMPSYDNFLIVVNATGATVTVACAGGTGVSIPTARTAILYCDAIDYKDATPSWLATATTLTNANDLLTYTQVEKLIANASIPASNGAILNSANDTTAGYLATKLVASGLLQRTTQNGGADEDSLVSATGYVAGGTNAYAISPTPIPGSPVAFQTSYLIAFQNANTQTACTLNDGSGTYTLLNDDGAALAPYDLPAGAMRLVIYDGAAFRVKAAETPVHIPMAAGLTLVSF